MYGGMEARLNSLEDKVEAMTDKVVDNKVLLAKIDEKLNHIPTTLQLVISMFAVFGVSYSRLQSYVLHFYSPFSLSFLILTRRNPAFNKKITKCNFLC